MLDLLAVFVHLDACKNARLLRNKKLLVSYFVSASQVNERAPVKNSAVFAKVVTQHLKSVS